MENIQAEDTEDKNNTKPSWHSTGSVLSNLDVICKIFMMSNEKAHFNDLEKKGCTNLVK